jgi:hypothetical protein
MTAGFGHSTAQAGYLANLSVAVTQEVDGYFLYEYTLAVDASSTASAVQFDLAVSPDADLQDIFNPAGWSYDYAAGVEAVSFFAEDFDSLIGPGESGVFSFRSLLRPLDLDYFLSGDTSPIPEVISGTIGSPATNAIPEPSAVVLLGISTVFVGISRFVHARRRTSANIHREE